MAAAYRNKVKWFSLLLMGKAEVPVHFEGKADTSPAD